MSTHTGQPAPEDGAEAAENPYLARPAPEAPSPAALGVEELSIDDCWRLIEASRLGRLAIATAEGRPDLFPVNFLTHARVLFIRSAPGTKLQHMAQAPAVTFEIDGSDERFHWSVIISAEAMRLDTDSDIEEAGILELVTWSPTDKHDFVQLTPTAVSGRRFPRPRQPRNASARRPVEHRQIATSAAERGEQRAPEAPTHDTKPQPIPHFAPRDRRA